MMDRRTIFLDIAVLVFYRITLQIYILDVGNKKTK
ncbi:hypothetical protein IKC_05743 [Bacillus cereus VD184]|uniref:Uncharacterized protein n=1 Tax=Bacillus cereus VD184 TaxID=1053242 RepID=A0A9W5R5U5_BACCE|nr:hypothetical protein IKC_05743 [Bacillus cereus VD184]